MKEVQNKNHTDEAKRLNEELDQNLKDLQPESKEAFQGFEVKEEKKAKKAVLKKEGIKTGLKSVDKETAIRAAGQLLCDLGSFCFHVQPLLECGHLEKAHYLEAR